MADSTAPVASDKLLFCEPDRVGNSCIMALVSPAEVYLVAHDGMKGERFATLILTVEDLDRIRTEMACLEGVNS